ncbi:MAG: ATP-binding protein [Bacillota bacterium]|nr:ATP-binding protein [Bacillota bacterium]
MTCDRRRDRGHSCLRNAALSGLAHPSRGSCWVPLAKDLFTFDGLGGRATFYRELLRVVLLACRADHALVVELDPDVLSTARPFTHVYPQPASERYERLWAFVAGYVSSAARQGVQVELPRDLRDALDLASMLIAPVFGDDELLAAVAVFRGASSPPFGAEADQLLHALTGQLPDLARRIAHDAETRARAPRLLRVLQARGMLRAAGRLCCLLETAVLMLERAGLANAVLFRILNLETGELEVIASSGRPRSARANDPVPSSQCRTLAPLRAGVIRGGAGLVDCPLLRGPKGYAEEELFCAPVRCGPDIAGVLELWMPQGERLGKADMRLVEAVAGAIGKGFAEAGVNRSDTRGDSGSGLADMFAAVTKTSSDPAHAAEILLRRLRANVAFDVGALAERRDEAEDFVVVQSCSFPPTGPDSDPGHPGRPEGFATFAIPATPGNIPGCATGEPEVEAWVRQVLQHARPFGNALAIKRLYLPHARWQVGLIVPLANAGSVGATLVLGKTGSEAFSQEELDFLDGVRDGIADLWESMALRTRPSASAAQEAMAERIATLEQLAAGAAHEIKNPLAVIKGYLQVMQSDPTVSDATKNRIGRLFRQLDQISNVVEEFSQLAKPVTADLAPLSLAGMLEEVLEIVEPQASNIGITIVRAYAEDTPEVMADGGKLEQVFLNLCRNSLEAMAPAGGGELRVSSRTSADGRFVEVEFCDTGPGMSGEVMSRIFCPFFTTKKHGTGLGLTISMQIVKQHGGTIRVESAPGAGAVFTVVLPVAPK